MEYNAAITKTCKITTELERVSERGEGSHMACTSLYVFIHTEVGDLFLILEENTGCTKYLFVPVLS